MPARSAGRALPGRRAGTRGLRAVGSESGGGVTRIAIAAPSAVIRAGLEALLAATPGWEVAGSFADASSLDSLQLDVLVAAVPVSELRVVSGAVPAIVLLTSEGQPEWT